MRRALAATELPTHDDVATIGSLEVLIVNLIQAVVAVVGIGLFVMLVTAGFNFLTAGGDPKKLEQAQQTMTQAGIGLVIIVGAYIIIRVLEAFTGLNLSEFTINFQ